MRGPISTGLALLLAAPALAAPTRTLLRPTGGDWLVERADAAPAAALDAFGFASVAWLASETGQPTRLFVQRYDPRRQAAGDALLAHDVAGDAWGLGATVARRGRLLLTWSEGTAAAPLARWQMRATDGALVAKDDLGAGQPTDSVVSGVDASGRFVLVWAEDDGLYAQALDSDGNVALARTRLASGAGRALLPRAVAVAPDGHFVVAWRDQSVTPAKAWARGFGPTGTPTGAAFALLGIDAAAHSRGRVLVVWTVGRDVQAQLYGRFYSPTGAALGAPFAVHSNAWAEGARVAVDGPGNFIVTYRGAVTGGADVLGRRFNADGTPDGRPFRLADTAGARAHVALSGNPAGDVVFAWHHRLGAAAPQLRARVFAVPPKGDFDGDLKSDLVLHRPSDGAARVWGMSEGRRASTLRVWRFAPGSDWTPVAADDFDGDRHQDLLYRNVTSGALSFVLMGGRDGVEACATAAVTPAPPAGARLAASGDLDQDGWADLVFQDEAAGALTVWKMEGLKRVGTLTPAPARPPNASYLLSAVQDYDGDGVRDLLWHDRGAGRVLQWLLDPALARTAQRLTDPPQAAGPEWEIVASADYGRGAGGRPGTQDVVWRSTLTERQVIWYLDFAGRRTSGVFTTPARPSDATWNVVAPR